MQGIVITMLWNYSVECSLLQRCVWSANSKVCCSQGRLAV